MKKHIGKILLLIAGIFYIFAGIYSLSINSDISWFLTKTIDIESIETQILPTEETELDIDNPEQIPIETEEYATPPEEIQNMDPKSKWVWLTLLQAEMYFMIFTGLVGLIFLRNLKRANFLFWVGIYMLIIHILDDLSWSLIFKDFFYPDQVSFVKFIFAIIYITGAYLNRIVAKTSSL